MAKTGPSGGPPEGARTDGPRAGRPTPAPIEWRAASPAGEKFGPTVPTVFAQWIREGRIEPDWLVWRSDWPDWRTAADARDALPAPLLGATPKPATAKPADPGPVVLDAPAQAGEMWRETGQKTGSAAAGIDYARRRRRTRRQQATLAIALFVVVMGMAAVLVFLLVGA